MLRCVFLRFAEVACCDGDHTIPHPQPILTLTFLVKGQHRLMGLKS